MAADYSLRQIEYFVEAVACGTLAGAAARCNTSQTAVSLAIRELERHLGVQLLIRRKAKGVVLTKAGARVLPQARDLLNLATEVRYTARSQKGEVSGRVAFGCTTTLAPFVLPRLLDELGTRHPGLVFDVIEGPVEMLRQSLLSGACDLALMYESHDMTGLTVEPLAEKRPYVLLSADHRFARHEAIRLVELADEALITPITSSGVYDSEAVLRIAGIEPRVGLRSASMEVVRAAVGRGLGYAILVQHWPSSETFEGRPVVSRPIADDVPSIRQLLVSASSVQPLPRVELVRHYCRSAFAQPLPADLE